MNVPTSTALRVLRGNPSKRPLERKPPLLPTEAPDCPEDLNLDPVALEAWQYYAPLLLSSGNLTKADRSILKSLCLTTSLLESARKQFREGSTIEYATRGGKTKVRKVAEPKALLVIGSRGGAIKNPFLSLIADLQKEERRYCQSLGLEPHVRGLNAAPAEKADDKWDL